jgi:hypothetical protein
MSDERTALATQAYVYGFPLVFDLEEVVRFTVAGMGALQAAPYNRWAHARKLANQDDTFVSVNNDTLYSIAQLDLGVGPIVLRVPDTDGRYYVLQHVDAWTNNFAYVGARATGTGAGTYVYVPPGWDGPLPDGATPIHCPTRVVSIVGRWAVAGDDDAPAVHALQDQLALEPVDSSAIATGVPAAQDGTDDALVFWEELRLWITAFPPPAGEAALLESFRPLGVLDAESPYGVPDPELLADLAAGVEAGKALLEQLSRPTGTPGAWSAIAHVFDYNDDFFEVGTIDDDQWKIADPKTRFATRALAARVGLWGNHGYEALYAMTFDDADGQPLDGANRYRLELSPTPPVGAFWSITMYDATDYFLVANPIDRFALGDRTAGIVYDPDGGITITIQHDEPTDPTARANWLPAPTGAFRPLMRMYVPSEDLLDGTYVLSPIQKVT